LGFSEIAARATAMVERQATMEMCLITL